MPTTSAVRPLQACPDAFVFPLITVTLPHWWEEEHPEECNDTGVNGKPPRAGFSGWSRFDRILLYFFKHSPHTANRRYHKFVTTNSQRKHTDETGIFRFLPRYRRL